LGGGWVVTSVVLSVRVRRELKEEAERLGINIREVVERALEEEIRRVKMERLKTVIGEALKAMDVGVKEWVEAIRESRLER
jgi:post-segregation antitoxin (ccd killing protein)